MVELEEKQGVYHLEKVIREDAEKHIKNLDVAGTTNKTDLAYVVGMANSFSFITGVNIDGTERLSRWLHSRYKQNPKELGEGSYEEYSKGN